MISDINHGIMIIEMFVLSMLARYAYRRPEPDAELTTMRNGVPVKNKDINPEDEANTRIVSVGYYKSCDKQKVSLVNENGDI